jgi:AcrR family transcriptional regulator
VSARDPKRLILDAALAIFVEVGFEHATVAAICARAGISNGALFHHFPTKGAIAEALYLRGIGDYQDGLLQVLARHRGPTAARAAIEAAVRHHLAWVEANRDLAWFMYERGRPDWEPTYGTAVRKLNRATAGRIRDWIAPLVAAGAVRDLPLAVLAACVVGPAHFIARRWISGVITARPTSFTEALADVVWAALAPGKARRSLASPPRTSPAALIEATALEAACAACPATEPTDWTVVQLTMSALSDSVLAPVGDARAPAVRLEGDGRIALIDIALFDADRGLAHRGHVVCLRRGTEAAC